MPRYHATYYSPLSEALHIFLTTCTRKNIVCELLLLHLLAPRKRELCALCPSKCWGSGLISQTSEFGQAEQRYCDEYETPASSAPSPPSSPLAISKQQTTQLRQYTHVSVRTPVQRAHFLPDPFGPRPPPSDPPEALSRDTTLLPSPMPRIHFFLGRRCLLRQRWQKI